MHQVQQGKLDLQDLRVSQGELESLGKLEPMEHQGQGDQLGLWVQQVDQAPKVTQVFKGHQDLREYLPRELLVLRVPLDLLGPGEMMVRQDLRDPRAHLVLPALLLR